MENHNFYIYIYDMIWYIYIYIYDIYQTSPEKCVFSPDCHEASEWHPHRFESTRDALHSTRLPSADLQKCRQRGWSPGSPGSEFWTKTIPKTMEVYNLGIYWVYNQQTMEIMEIIWNHMKPYCHWMESLTRNNGFYHEIWGVPVDFPLNQSNDLWRSRSKKSVMWFKTMPQNNPGIHHFYRWYLYHQKWGGLWHCFALEKVWFFVGEVAIFGLLSKSLKAELQWPGADFMGLPWFLTWLKLRWLKHGTIQRIQGEFTKVTMKNMGTNWMV